MMIAMPSAFNLADGMTKTCVLDLSTADRVKFYTKAIKGPEPKFDLQPHPCITCIFGNDPRTSQNVQILEYS
jgi:hypothetical protein